jgi:hypothetical protein
MCTLLSHPPPPTHTHTHTPTRSNEDDEGSIDIDAFASIQSQQETSAAKLSPPHVPSTDTGRRAQRTLTRESARSMGTVVATGHSKRVKSRKMWGRSNLASSYGCASLPPNRPSLNCSSSYGYAPLPPNRHSLHRAPFAVVQADTRPSPLRLISTQTPTLTIALTKTLTIDLTITLTPAMSTVDSGVWAFCLRMTGRPRPMHAMLSREGEEATAATWHLRTLHERHLNTLHVTTASEGRTS